MDSKSIVLFDGVCKFCNGSVNFIIERDPKGIFSFAPLQSKPGAELLQKHGISEEEAMESIVLIHNGKVLRHSTAALTVARYLSGGWSLFYYLFIWIPAILRDFIYKWIARNRYNWFGKHDACMLPSPDVRKRFLDESDKLI